MPFFFWARCELDYLCGLAIAEIFDVDIGAKPDVIGKVPANVIRVVINDDLIVSPVPIAAVFIIIGSDAEVETTEPEA